MRLALVLAIALLGCSSSHGGDPESPADDGDPRTASARGSSASKSTDHSDGVGSLRGTNDAGADQDEESAGSSADVPVDTGHDAEPPNSAAGMGAEETAGSSAAPGAGSSAPMMGAAGAGGSALPQAGSGSPTIQCSDDDSDGVCDDLDTCPGGSDADADRNGYADGCDQVLAKFQIPKATKTIADVSSRIRISGSLAESMSLFTTSPLTSAGTTSFDVDGGPEYVIAAAARLQSGAAAISASIEANGSVGVSGQRWFVSNQNADMTSKTITRFVLVVDPLELVPNGTKTDVTTGGRWEIRGY
jgi:hypothetical protein